MCTRVKKMSCKKGRPGIQIWDYSVFPSLQDKNPHPMPLCLRKHRKCNLLHQCVLFISPQRILRRPRKNKNQRIWRKLQNVHIWHLSSHNLGYAIIKASDSASVCVWLCACVCFSHSSLPFSSPPVAAQHRKPGWSEGKQSYQTADGGTACAYTAEERAHTYTHAHTLCGNPATVSLISLSL